MIIPYSRYVRVVEGQCDSRFPFLWEGAGQPPARWHGDGEGPVHYLTDTPDGAWAEFLRHEEIRDPQDLETVTRAEGSRSWTRTDRASSTLTWSTLTLHATARAAS